MQTSKSQSDQSNSLLCDAFSVQACTAAIRQELQAVHASVFMNTGVHLQVDQGVQVELLRLDKLGHSPLPSGQLTVLNLQVLELSFQCLHLLLVALLLLLLTLPVPVQASWLDRAQTLLPSDMDSGFCNRCPLHPQYAVGTRLLWPKIA